MRQESMPSFEAGIYLTSQAIREFQRAEQALHIQPLDNGCIVEYKSGNQVHKIIVALKKCDGSFIDGISRG